MGEHRHRIAAEDGKEGGGHNFNSSTIFNALDAALHAHLVSCLGFIRQH